MKGSSIYLQMLPKKVKKLIIIIFFVVLLMLPFLRELGRFVVNSFFFFSFYKYLLIQTIKTKAGFVVANVTSNSMLFWAYFL